MAGHGRGTAGGLAPDVSLSIMDLTTHSGWQAGQIEQSYVQSLADLGHHNTGEQRFLQSLWQAALLHAL